SGAAGRSMHEGGRCLQRDRLYGRSVLSFLLLGPFSARAEEPQSRHCNTAWAESACSRDTYDLVRSNAARNGGLPTRHRAWRKGRDTGEVCRQLAREALQKRHYVAGFGVAQRYPELHPRHDADGLWKRRHRPVVKIGRGHRDIPQARNTENIKVVGVLGDISASVVDGLAARCLPIGLNDAKFSVHSAANKDAVVARYAAGIDEGIEAAASFGRQCIDITSEVAIKRRWCHQGPLVGPDGFGNVRARHWMRIVRKSRFEQRGVTRNLFEPVDNCLLVRLPVRDRRCEGLYHLILEAVTVAAPVND